MYAAVGCKFCANLEELFRRADLEYTKIVVGEDENQCPMTLFQEKYPKAVGFPYVVIDGEEIGGLVEVAKLFLDKGLVTVPKNERT